MNKFRKFKLNKLSESKVGVKTLHVEVICSEITKEFLQNACDSDKHKYKL